MEDANLGTCQTCFRPKAEAAIQQPTQWVSVCRCDRPYSPNAQFSIDVCANCKKRIAAHAQENASFPGLCSCSEPSTRQIATYNKPNETDAVTLDLASVGLSAEKFPIERYTPIAILGESPRSVVTLCRDKQRGTKVAVKCFKGIAPALFPTFESEVHKNKQLAHTNIAKIVDSGIRNGKTPYVVTEYKDGFNVEQCFALYGSPSYDVAVNILIGACEALNYGQKQGLLHRDIRPGNVIFVDDLNSQPSVCITDFALPKIKESEVLSDPWFAIYMSGDEARNLPYTEKSEVYSLGCTGYMMLAGRPPFEEGTALDIKNSHALKLPPRISTIKFDNTRPKDLDEVIEKCLEKDPRDRFESIAKFQERLEVFPRRIKMKIDAIVAARKRAKIIRIAVVILVVAAVSAAGIFAITHH